MDTEMHVMFALCVSVDNEHFFVTTICDKVLFSYILQGNNIGGVVLAEPHIPVLAWDLCLV